MKTILVFAFIALFFVQCKNDDSTQTAQEAYVKIQGETMGTTYNVTYKDLQQRNLKASIDSLLRVINDEVSTYIPTATISQFNQTQDSYNLGIDSAAIIDQQASGAVYEKRQHFTSNYFKAREVFVESDGYFDPTVMPLVNYWGFGYTPKKTISDADSVVVDSLLDFVGMNKVHYVGEELTKDLFGVQLDFSALAKGYGVDAIGLFLERKGIQDYMVEIGGEVRSRGKNNRGEVWSIGINTPQETADLNDLEAVLLLENKSVATSGNYRNFYEVEGKKYSHTINPKTGFPERNTLLSASVLADDCMTADAYATAFMAMGVEKAFAKVQSMDELEAYFIYSKEDGTLDVRFTAGMEKFVKRLAQ